jgi:hypothetical protein
VSSRSRKLARSAKYAQEGGRLFVRGGTWNEMGYTKGTITCRRCGEQISRERMHFHLTICAADTVPPEEAF